MNFFLQAGLNYCSSLANLASLEIRPNFSSFHTLSLSWSFRLSRQRDFI